MIYSFKCEKKNISKEYKRMSVTYDYTGIDDLNSIIEEYKIEMEDYLIQEEFEKCLFVNEIDNLTYDELLSCFEEYD